MSNFHIYLFIYFQAKITKQAIIVLWYFRHAPWFSVCWEYRVNTMVYKFDNQTTMVLFINNENSKCNK